MSGISLSNISYFFPDGFRLLSDISVTFNCGVTGLVGSNGSGKSTLAKIASGVISPTSGSVALPGKIKYLEQEFFESTGNTIASLLGVEAKFAAWLRVNEGKGDIPDFIELDDDWELDARIRKALERVGLEGFSGSTPVSRLSGGETIKARLAALFLRDYDFVILDEPTNHLDKKGRNAVFSFIEDFPRNKGMIIISHDRELLRRVDRIVELSPSGVKTFGGNYDLYKEVSDAEKESAVRTLEERRRKLENDISKAEQVIRGQISKSKRAGKTEKDAGIPTIMRNKMKATAEKTTRRNIEVHQAKINRAKEGIAEAKKKVIKEKKVTFDLLNSAGRSSVAFACTGLNILFGNERHWSRPMNLTISRGDRLRITGANGSGKSSLCKVISGEAITIEGETHILPANPVYLDQKLSFLDRSKTILENASREKNGALDITEIRIRLGRLGFYGDDCLKPTTSLSGGELIRAAVGVIVSLNTPPDILMLDEPTNNLDLTGIEMLQNAIRTYPGTLIVITHDDDFAAECGITRTIDLDEIL